MKLFLLSDKGVARSLNEDSGGMFSKEHQWLAVVADGMGGHQAGEVASQKTLEYIKEAWDSETKPLPMDKAEQWLRHTITDINSKLLTFANENEDCRGMGTTIVAAIVTDSEMTVSHVGDSRAYLFTAKGDQSLLTKDHTLVQELLNQGQLTEADARVHPRKHMLMRALGTEDQITVDCLHHPFNKGETLLICSDGLSNQLTGEQMAGILLSDKSLEVTGKKLIGEAIRLGETDNITVALVHNDEGGPV